MRKPATWMHLVVALCAALLLGPAMGGVVMATNDEPPLEALRWQKRVIVVLADTIDDAALVEQVRRLAAAEAALVERDTVVIEATRDGSRMHGSDLEPPSVAQLRRAYGGGSDGFRLMLIGKDGGVKLRSREPVDVAEILGLIDSMPMRRHEMRKRGSGGA